MNKHFVRGGAWLLPAEHTRATCQLPYFKDTTSSILGLRLVDSAHGGRRVVRGGSWYDYPEFLRSAYRFRCNVDDWDDAIGFRLVQEPATHD